MGIVAGFLVTREKLSVVVDRTHRVFSKEYVAGQMIKGVRA